MDHSIRPFKGKFLNLGRRVYVDPQSTVIGDVVIGDDVSVWPGAVIRGDMHLYKGRRQVQRKTMRYCMLPTPQITTPKAIRWKLAKR